MFIVRFMFDNYFLKERVVKKPWTFLATIDYKIRFKSALGFTPLVAMFIQTDRTHRIEISILGSIQGHRRDCRCLNNEAVPSPLNILETITFDISVQIRSYFINLIFIHIIVYMPCTKIEETDKDEQIHKQ